MDINDLLASAVASGASDLHLKVGSYPMMRLHGTLAVVTEEKRLEREDTEAMADALFSPELREKFRTAREVDLAYSIPGLGRFRCNVFQQRGTVGLVLRVIPTRIKSIDELGLPPVLKRIAEEERGLVLVTGTTGALVARVRSGDLEAAFVAEPFTPQDLEVQQAFAEELVLITPKGFGAVRSAKDVLHSTILAFANGCSYRRRLESWLGRAGISPERVMEYGSYHAIVACAAAGSGIAIVPRSVLEALRHGQELDIHPLPRDVAQANTLLVWRNGHHSTALDAMRKALTTRGLPAALPRPVAASPASRNGARRRAAAHRAPRSSAPAATR